MRRLSLLASFALAAAVAVGAEANESDARMEAVLSNVLLLHVDGDAASIPMFFECNGSVYYVYLSYKLDELNSNYSQTVPWKRQGDELCSVKTQGVMTCFVLPQLQLGEAVDTQVRAVGPNGDMKWQKNAKVMLLKGRPAGSFTASTPAARTATIPQDTR